MAIVSKIKKQSSAPQKDVMPSYYIEAVDSAADMENLLEEAITTIVDIAGYGNPNTRKRIIDSLCNNAVYQLPWRKEDIDKAQSFRNDLAVAVETGDHGKQFDLEKAEEKEKIVVFQYQHYKKYHDLCLEAYKQETGTDYKPKTQGSNKSGLPDMSKYRK